MSTVSKASNTATASATQANTGAVSAVERRKAVTEIVQSHSRAIAASSGATLAAVALATAATLATLDVDSLAAKVVAARPALGAAVQRVNEIIARIAIATIRQSLSIPAIDTNSYAQGVAVETIVDEAGDYLVNEGGDYLVV